MKHHLLTYEALFIDLSSSIHRGTKYTLSNQQALLLKSPSTIHRAPKHTLQSLSLWHSLPSHQAQFTDLSVTLYGVVSHRVQNCQAPFIELPGPRYRIFRHNIESQAPSTSVSAYWIPKLETSHISTDIGGARFRGIRNPSLRSTRRGGQEIRSLPGAHSGYRVEFHYPLLQGCSRSATSKANLHTTCGARSLALAIPRYVLPSRHVTIEM